MIIFTIKLLKNIRTAIAGRKYPHQLAWAVAFGVLLGIVPHGNLLALGILILILSLRLNHAMAAITAIGVSFAATKLDPLSNQVGHFVLSHDTFGPLMSHAWRWPLVPWTNLNNTVVMGSSLLGFAALVPIFMITYPIFRLIAPKSESPDDSPSDDSVAAEAHSVLVVDQAHDQVPPPRIDAPPRQPITTAADAEPASESITPSSESVDQFIASIATDTDSIDEEAELDELDQRVSVETRIDVIRMKDYRDVSNPDSSGSVTKPQSPTAGQGDQEKPLDEALSYLLRQLRDSQQRKAG